MILARAYVIASQDELPASVLSYMYILATHDQEAAGCIQASSDVGTVVQFGQTCTMSNQ